MRLRVTYRPAPDDWGVTVMFGKVFEPGVPVVVDVSEREAVKLKGNQWFEVSPAVGRPTRAKDENEGGE